jgi:hypothetical protein
MVALPESPTGLSLAWALPGYPVGRQMRWLLGAVVKPPVPTAILKAHFDGKFLSAVPPASFNSVLTGLRLVTCAACRAVSLRSSRPVPASQ